jgi:Family of unknown function (DUF6463)
MKVTNGRLLGAIGIVHTLFGVMLGMGSMGPPAGRNLFAEIAAAGVVGTIDLDPWRGVVFWFLFFGFMALALAQLLHRMERAGHAIPRATAWSLAAIGLGGVLLMPASGFWMVLAVAARIWWRARLAAATMAGCAAAAATSKS